MIYVVIPTTPERSERLKIALASITASVCNQPVEVRTEVSSGEGAVKPLIRLLKSVDGLVLCSSDDVTLDPECLQKLYDEYVNKFPNQDGICILNDGHYEVGRATLFFGHSKTLLENLYPGYVHMFADREIADVMGAKGLVHFVEGALATHHHYSYGMVEIDETYRFSEAQSRKDGDLYYLRKENGFPR